MRDNRTGELMEGLKEGERERGRERWGMSIIPMTCSLGPLQAVAVAALILSTT